MTFLKLASWWDQTGFLGSVHKIHFLAFILNGTECKGLVLT